MICTYAFTNFWKPTPLHLVLQVPHGHIHPWNRSESQVAPSASTSLPLTKPSIDREGKRLFLVRQIKTNANFLVFYISVVKNTMDPSKDNINAVLVLLHTSAVSYVREHIIAQTGLAADHSDLTYRISNEPARTKHALFDNNDMTRAWQSLGHVTDAARSVQPTMYIYNMVCDWVLISKHREALPVDDLGCPSETNPCTYKTTNNNRPFLM